MELPYEIIVLDLKANARPGNEMRIVEIGAVRMDKTLNILREFSMLVHPGALGMSPKGTEVTGITDADLAGAAPFEVVAPQFEVWCGAKYSGYVLSSWGCYFDIALLRSEYSRIGKPYPHPGRALDLKTVAWWYFWMEGRRIQQCEVHSSLRRLGMTFDGNPHRALDDARNEARILREIAKQEWGLFHTAQPPR